MSPPVNGMPPTLKPILGQGISNDIEMGDADELDIGGDDVENNSSKNEVLTSKKNNFPSAVPTRQKFPNQDYESYEKGYDSDGCLITFDEYAKRGENPDDFVEEVLAELSIKDGTAI